MTFSYSNTVKANRMQNVLDAITGKTYVVGSGSALTSTLVIGTSSLSGATGVLATLALDATPFTLDVSVPTLPKLLMQDTPVSVASSAAGTAALAEIRNNAGTVVVGALTVGAGSGEVSLSTTTITFPGTVQITAGTITHAP